MLASVNQYLDVFVSKALDYHNESTGYNIDRMEKHPVEEQIAYYNGSIHGVAISRRNGIVHVARPSKGIKNDEFVIAVTYVVGCHFLDRFIADLERSHRYCNVETQVYINNVKKQQINGMSNRSGFARVSIHYMVDVNRLLGVHKNSVYIENLDTLISLDSVGKIAAHPFANAGKRPMETVYSKEVMKMEDCFYQVRIVDNLKRYGRRYINLTGTVLAIDPIEEANKSSGVEIRFTEWNTVTDMKDIRILSYTFAEADKLGILFKTADEATTFGDNSYRLKKELMDHQDAINRSKAENELRALEIKRAELDLVERKAAAEREAIACKADRDRRQRIYDEDLARADTLIAQRKREMELEDQSFYMRKQDHERLKQSWQAEQDELNRRHQVLMDKRKVESDHKQAIENSLEHERQVKLNLFKTLEQQAKSMLDYTKITLSIVGAILGLMAMIYKGIAK